MKQKKKNGAYKRPRDWNSISQPQAHRPGRSGKEKSKATSGQSSTGFAERSRKNSSSIFHSTEKIESYGFGTPLVKTNSSGEGNWEPIKKLENADSCFSTKHERLDHKNRSAGAETSRFKKTTREDSKTRSSCSGWEWEKEPYGEGAEASQQGQKNGRHKRRRFQFSISPGFLLLMAGLFYFDRQGIFLWLVPVCMAHEIAHWVTLHLLGGGITGIRLSISGAALELREEKTLSYPRELAATLAGPFANLVLAFAAAFLGKQFDLPASFLISGLSLGFMAFNLLPAEPLDGGRAIYLMLAWLLTPTFAAYVVRGLSIVTATAVTAGGCYVIFHGGGFTLLTTGIWLMWKTFTPRKGLVKLALSV